MIKAKQPFSQGSVTMVRDGIKLIFTFEEDRLDTSGHVLELYDLAADPEELNNLYTDTHPAARQMLAEMQAQIERADQPYK